FRYTEIRNNQDPTNPFQRPYLIVRLIHGPKHKDVISLVDSGADLCLFHSDIGRMLGIDMESGSEIAFQGVSGARETASLHRVSLTVGSLGSISLDAGFTDSMAVGTGLLGQQGFFEQFHINFQLDEKLFEIVEVEA
ncbi:MAG: retropepsin-like aspartic protease, partial [Pyrinomonadaceae bacterium]